MPIAVFGPKTFAVSQNRVYTFSEFNRTSSLNIEEQEVDGQKPSTYIKGPGLDEVGFSIPLVRQAGLDIRQEIDSWVALKDARTPYLLLLGNRPVGQNKFLLVSVAVEEAEIDGAGDYRRAKLQLQFKEFMRYGAKKDSSTQKRSNPNVTVSRAAGTKLDALEQELFGSTEFHYSGR